jgi:hypothetical protein
MTNSKHLQFFLQKNRPNDNEDVIKSVSQNVVSGFSNLGCFVFKVKTDQWGGWGRGGGGGVFFTSLLHLSLSLSLSFSLIVGLSNPLSLSLCLIV